MLMWILIFLSYLFVLSEIFLVLTKRSKQKSVKKKRDKGSLILLWIIITVCLTVGFNMANYGNWSLFNFIIASVGLLLFFLGLIIRWTTIFQLKKEFTVDVVINRDHELKTDGLYRIVRHPSYLGLFLITTGLSIGMNNPLSFLIITIPVFLAIVYRIYVEETVLFKEFGSEYEEYSKSTKRLIPYIY